MAETGQHVEELYGHEPIGIGTAKEKETETPEKKGFFKKYGKPVVATIAVLGALAAGVYFGLKGKENKMTPEQYNALMNQAGKTQTQLTTKEIEAREKSSAEYQTTQTEHSAKDSGISLDYGKVNEAIYEFRSNRISRGKSHTLHKDTMKEVDKKEEEMAIWYLTGKLPKDLYHGYQGFYKVEATIEDAKSSIVYYLVKLENGNFKVYHIGF